MTPDAGLPPPSGIDRLVEIDRDTIDGFQRNGHAVVRGLVSPQEISEFRPAIEALVGRLAEKAVPIEARDTYGRAFLQAVPRRGVADRPVP